MNDRRRVLVKSTLELNAIGTGIAALLDHVSDGIERSVRETLTGKRRVQQERKGANEAVSRSHRISHFDRRTGNGESLRNETDFGPTSCPRPISAPFFPQVMMTIWQGCFAVMISIIFSSDSLFPTPVMSWDSVSLGISTSTQSRDGSSSVSSGEAGAGFRIVTIPRCLHVLKMCRMVGMGISSWRTTTRHELAMGMESNWNETMTTILPTDLKTEHSRRRPQ